MQVETITQTLIAMSDLSFPKEAGTHLGLPTLRASLQDANLTTQPVQAETKMLPHRKTSCTGIKRRPEKKEIDRIIQVNPEHAKLSTLLTQW